MRRFPTCPNPVTAKKAARRHAQRYDEMPVNLGYLGADDDDELDIDIDMTAAVQAAMSRDDVKEAQAAVAEQGKIEEDFYKKNLDDETKEFLYSGAPGTLNQKCSPGTSEQATIPCHPLLRCLTDKPGRGIGKCVTPKEFFAKINKDKASRNTHYMVMDTKNLIDRARFYVHKHRAGRDCQNYITRAENKIVQIHRTGAMRGRTLRKLLAQAAYEAGGAKGCVDAENAALTKVAGKLKLPKLSRQDPRKKASKRELTDLERATQSASVPTYDPVSGTMSYPDVGRPERPLTAKERKAIERGARRIPSAQEQDAYDEILVEQVERGDITPEEAGDLMERFQAGESLAPATKKKTKKEKKKDVRRRKRREREEREAVEATEALVDPEVEIIEAGVEVAYEDDDDSGDDRAMLKQMYDDGDIDWRQYSRELKNLGPTPARRRSGRAVKAEAQKGRYRWKINKSGKGKLFVRCRDMERKVWAKREKCPQPKPSVEQVQGGLSSFFGLFGSSGNIRKAAALTAKTRT